MNLESQFIGPREKMLIVKLKTDGILKLEYIYGSYNSAYVARGFIEKLLNFNIARMIAPDTLGYVSVEERDKKE
jgi:hypothetical protein